VPATNSLPRDILRPPGAPRTTYDIEVRYIEQTKHLEGLLEIQFENNSSEAISSVLIAWPSKQGSNIELHLKGTEVSLEENSDAKHVITFAKPVQPGHSAELSFSFEGPLRERDWHPRLWWGEDVLAFDDYIVRIEGGDSQWITSGRWDPAQEAFIAEGAPCFGLLRKRKQWLIIEDEIRGVLVRVAFSKSEEVCARHCLKAACEAIDYYVDWVGFYPACSFWIIPGIDKPWGGGPLAPGIVLLYGMSTFDESEKDDWTYLTAHEIGHQYWGEYILTRYMPWPSTPFFKTFEQLTNAAGFESGRGLIEWLHLGMGIYMDRMFAQQRGLDIGPPRQRMRFYLKGVAEGIDTTLEGRPYPKGIDYNNIIAHSKGFAAISAFAQVIGHQAFERVVFRCLREYGGQRVTSGILQSLCEEEYGQPLDELFEDWVRSSKVLDYRISRSRTVSVDGEYRTEVVVACHGTLRMPVPVRAEFEDGMADQRVTDPSLDETVLVFRSPAPIKRIRLDPEDLLPLPEREAS